MAKPADVASTLRNPMQPVYLDSEGVTRFKENAIVRYLLDAGPHDLNHLARIGRLFNQQDQEQFAQLIGYSIAGYGELSYVSERSYATARALADEVLMAHDE